VSEPETFEFLGESFAVAERVSTLALMRFAKIASAGVDVDDMAGLAAMYDLLQQAVDPSDWARFESHADAQRVQSDDLLAVIQEVLPIIAARPTGRPSDSSDGRPRTSEPSADDSSSQVIARLEQRGRPDLALMVDEAQRARASRASA
jgi:hypothetical protein